MQALMPFFQNRKSCSDGMYFLDFPCRRQISEKSVGVAEVASLLDATLKTMGLQPDAARSHGERPRA